MKLRRRQFQCLVAGAVAFLAIPCLALAQAYPTKAVYLIVPFGPGGQADILARLLGQSLSDRLGQPVIIDNRLGAGSNIGTEAVVRAPPDGYTLLLANSSNVINTTLYDKLNFDFIRDIAPVATIATAPGVMVVAPEFPAKTVLEFVAYAKANPAKVAMATAGSGSGPHILGEMFRMMAGVDMVPIPYRSSVPALADLMGGQVQVMFDTLPSSIEFIKAGKLRALGVATAKRIEQLLEVPTIGEFVSGYEGVTWGGIGAPKNTAPEIIDKLNKEVAMALADPKLKARITELGATVFVTSPADFAKLIVRDTEKWGKVIRAANIKAD
jgi:tripartite-type tricarboxylate transporter receptor subunit TctC